jgi:hypothetical protein
MSVLRWLLAGLSAVRSQLNRRNNDEENRVISFGLVPVSTLP